MRTPRSSTPQAPATLEETVRRNLIRLAISLVALGLLAGFIAYRYRTELDAVTAWAFDTLGLGGMVGLIFFTDAFVSPFPPDTVLLLLSASEYHSQWPWLLTAIGLVSSAAGCLGYGCGRVLSHRTWARRLIDPIRTRSEDSIQRFGPWAVALGALTPVPFSITCWAAGLMHVPLRRFLPPCLLRVPRYLIYYAVIAYSSRLFS